MSGWRRSAAIWLASLLALATATVFGHLMALSVPAALFVYLTATMLVAVIAPQRLAIGFSVLAALALNFFFAEPRFTLAVHAVEDISALAGFILVSVVITTLVRRTGNLAERQRNLTQLLNLSRDPVLARDRSDNITFWNRGAEDVYGWSAAEVIGKNVHDLLKTRFPLPLEEIQRELERNGHWQGEVVHTRRDGTLVTVQSRWSIQSNDRGDAIATLEANDDITERRAAETLLQASQAVYLAAAQGLTQTGSIAWNTRTGELQWSAETYRICGMEPQAALSTDVIQKIVHPDDAASYQSAVQTAIKDRGRFDHVLRIVRPGGDVRVIHMVGRFLEEKPEQFVGALTDITSRREEEEARRISEFHYRNMFAAMAASFWELDFSGVTPILRDILKQGVKDLPGYFAANPGVVRQMMRATRVIDVNDQTVALFGRGDKQEILRDVEPFWADSSLQVFAAAVVASIRRIPGFSAETRLRRLDGSEFDGLFTVSFPPDGVASSKFLIAVIDISERVRAQEALRRLQSELAHAARVSTLGELAASIAHEINQPLAAIATNASAGRRWLDRPEPNLDEARSLATRIEDDARRAADIIARIRNMATREHAPTTELSMASVIEEAAAFLHHDMQAQQVSLQLDLEPDLPSVAGDRTQLQQVVVNLAMNAAQAMVGASSGPRQVTIRAASADGKVRVSVEDNGPGIPPEHIDLLFQSFFTTKAGGMGIGLPICRNIVEAHDGEIRAENREQGGARFTFTLPAHGAHTSV